MKNRFWLFKRGQTFYVEDSLTHKHESLHTKDRREPNRLRDKNEAVSDPTISLAVGRAYLTVHDPRLAKRSWSKAMDELASLGCEASCARCAVGRSTSFGTRHSLKPPAKISAARLKATTVAALLDPPRAMPVHRMPSPIPPRSKQRDRRQSDNEPNDRQHQSGNRQATVGVPQGVALDL